MKWRNELHGAEVGAAEPPLTSISWGKSCDSSDGWEGIRCEDELCYVGVVLEVYSLGGVIVHDDTDFTTIIIVNNAAANVNVLEGKAAPWLDSACDGWGNC